jgi:hypothetical protein
MPPEHEVTGSNPVGRVVLLSANRPAIQYCRDGMEGSPASNDSRPPRGALIVVAVGLLACLVAALAATGKGEGEAAQLEWVKVRKMADSKPAPVPGGRGTMRLSEVGIASTGTNVSGYSLYRVAATLEVSAGSPVGGGQILCAVAAPHGTEIAQSAGGLRATYPRSSEGGIFSQEFPETVLMQFSSHSSELAVLETTDLRKNRFTNERGVKVEWPEYTVGTERIKYFLAGKPKSGLELPFFTIWRSTDVPSAKIACTLKTSAGKATVRASAALAKRTPPINEQAEEEKEEEREEQEEEKEG